MSALPPQTEGCNRIGAGRCPLSCYTTCVRRRTTSPKSWKKCFSPPKLLEEWIWIKTFEPSLLLHHLCKEKNNIAKKLEKCLSPTETFGGMNLNQNLWAWSVPKLCMYVRELIWNLGQPLPFFRLGHLSQRRRLARTRQEGAPPSRCAGINVFSELNQD